MWSRICPPIPAGVSSMEGANGFSWKEAKPPRRPMHLIIMDPAPSLGPVARRTLEALQVDSATHLDDLLGKIEDTSTSELLAALFELEMMGLVRQLPGKNFVKVW